MKKPTPSQVRKMQAEKLAAEQTEKAAQVLNEEAMKAKLDTLGYANAAPKAVQLSMENSSESATVILDIPIWNLEQVPGALSNYLRICQTTEEIESVEIMVNFRKKPE